MAKSAPASRPSGLPTAALHVLLGLADGPRHGYAIKQDVERVTRGSIRLGPGTLYEAIARLEAQGLIEEAPDAGADEAAGAPRRTYKLTRTGLALARAEVDRLDALVDWARSSRLLAERGRP
ncbi:MAG: PadR family transcriptional regulator [Vicinamibacteria bacterium]|nr:PadR family transcriptional regulator [Vicinamibacteria bacterium]